MISDSMNSLIGKPVIVVVKSQGLYEGKLCPAGPKIFTIAAIENPGIVLQGGSFMPWSNILSIAPSEAAPEESAISDIAMKLQGRVLTRVEADSIHALIEQRVR